MKSGINRIAALSLSLTLGLASLLSGASLAQSQCKGLEKQACERKADCSWVDGYKRKDGKQVSSYCRATSKQSATTSSTTKKDTKKSEDKKTSDKK